LRNLERKRAATAAVHEAASAVAATEAARVVDERHASWPALAVARSEERAAAAARSAVAAPVAVARAPTQPASEKGASSTVRPPTSATPEAANCSVGAPEAAPSAGASNGCGRSVPLHATGKQVDDAAVEFQPATAAAIAEPEAAEWGDELAEVTADPVTARAPPAVAAASATAPAPRHANVPVLDFVSQHLEGHSCALHEKYAGLLVERGYTNLADLLVVLNSTDECKEAMLDVPTAHKHSLLRGLRSIASAGGAGNESGHTCPSACCLL